MATEDDTLPLTSKERLSQACFFVASSKKSSKKSKNVFSKSDECGGFTRLAEWEDDKNVARRHKQYLYHASQLQNDIRAMLKKCNESTINSVCHFVCQSHSGTATEQILKVFGEISTALVSLGANTADHPDFFDHLMANLHENSCPHVARLRARRCPTLQQAVRNSLEQIIAVDSGSQLDDDLKKSDKKFKHVAPDFSIFQHWYKNSYPGSQRGPPVVIIFEDFEQFNLGVLDDFIVLASNLLMTARIPFVFVFGLATTFDSVRVSLSPTATSRLSTRRFAVSPASHMMEDVLKCFTSSAYPLWLGGKAYQLLHENFNNYAVSFASLEQTLQAMLLDHFFSNSWSFLCSENVDECCDELKEEHLEQLRALMSFRRHVESLDSDPEQQIKLLESHEATTNEISLLLKALRQYKTKFGQALLCLQSVHRECGEQGRNEVALGTFFQVALQSDIVDQPLYRVAMQGVRAGSRSQLERVLEECKTIFKPVNGHLGEDLQGCGDFEEWNLLERLSARLQYLKDRQLDNVAEEETSDEEDNDGQSKRVKKAHVQADGMEEMPKGSDSSANKKMRILRNDVKKEPALAGAVLGNVSVDEEAKRFNWGIKKRRKVALLRTTGLDSNWSKRHKSLCKFEAARNEIFRSLDEIFRRLLRPPNQLPLHEVVFYELSPTTEAVVMPNQRQAIHRALAHPESCLPGLGMEQTAIQSDSLDWSAMPDMCTAYGVLPEGKRRISLADWLSGFGSVLFEECDWCPNDWTNESRENDSATAQANKEKAKKRFNLALKDLQLIGLVRPVKSRSDCVEWLGTTSF